MRSRARVEAYRRQFPAGSRIELLETLDDPYTPLSAGTQGTVKWVDDAGQIQVMWDDGGSLALIPTRDKFRLLTLDEKQEDGESKEDGANLDERQDTELQL